MYEEFDKLILNSIKNEDRLVEIIKDDISKHIELDFTQIDESLFMKRAVDMKFVLQSNRSIFWKIYYFLGEFNHPIITPTNAKIQTQLNQNGLVVLKNFVSKEDLEALKQEHKSEFSKIQRPEDVYDKRSQIVHLDGGVRIDFGNKYHARDRIAYKKDAVPKELNKIYTSPIIKQIVQEYTNSHEIIPSNIIYESVYTPHGYREDRGWHIDTLMDQFKVLVALNDIDADTAPFTYVPGYHKQFTKKQEHRYHHIYANGGYQAGILNHFEENFVDGIENKTEAYIKAGDVVLFDSRIQHSVKYPCNGKQRDNIMMYYSSLRTNRNRFLGRIDKHLKMFYAT
jgi:ectoine hydroxylase-related dioxygenase (phytanoyl-CoA dioxygenase family)